jgi:hypothetical protein
MTGNPLTILRNLLNKPTPQDLTPGTRALTWHACTQLPGPHALGYPRTHLGNVLYPQALPLWSTITLKLHNPDPPPTLTHTQLLWTTISPDQHRLATKQHTSQRTPPHPTGVAIPQPTNSHQRHQGGGRQGS